jgi:hypothetical protein
MRGQSLYPEPEDVPCFDDVNSKPRSTGKLVPMLNQLNTTQ